MSSAVAAVRRCYYYTVDHNGGLFLEPTRIRNVMSSYKDPAFLDFFTQRIRKNTIDDSSSSEAREAYRRGFHWVSPCGPEINYIKPDETPIVYQNIIKDRLTYAGTLSTLFVPSSLRVCRKGYLYHPSPLRPSRRDSNPSISPYGSYSLLRSPLVLEAFSKSLDLAEDGTGGTYEWNDQTHRIEAMEDRHGEEDRETNEANARGL